MTAPALVVDTATGVSVALPIAGPGVRALAFIIDVGIRGVLAAAWYGVAAVLYNGRLQLAAPVDPEAGWFAAVVIPAAAIYLLYHFVLEVAMHGRTPGKRIAGVRLVTAAGAPPGAGALLTRNIFRIVDGFPGVYSVGLIATLLTPRHQRIGDLAAGTLLVYERTDVPLQVPAIPPAGFDAASVEVAADLLARWDALARPARAALARTLLARTGAHDATADDDAALRAAVQRVLQQDGA